MPTWLIMIIFEDKLKKKEDIFSHDDINELSSLRLS
jgi:hypothetical protein